MSIGLSTDRLKTLRQSNNCQTRWFSLTPATVVVTCTFSLAPDRIDEELLIIERIKRGERMDHLRPSAAARPILGTNGQIIGASKIARDITEQNLAQDLQSESFHIACLNTVSHMALGLAHVRRLLYVAMTRAKDELDLVVPQRFYTYQQSKAGDRHVYSCRSRFIPDGIIDSFDCQAWHDRVQGSNRTAKKTGATTDVAASLRRMWR